MDEILEKKNVRLEKWKNRGHGVCVYVYVGFVELITSATMQQYLLTTTGYAEPPGINIQ